MCDDQIVEVLLLLKVCPSKFDETNYNKETLKELKEIIESADILYGTKKICLINKYYNYINQYFLKKSNSNEVKDISELKKIVFGFFYKSQPENLEQAYVDALSIINDSFKQIDICREIGTVDSMQKILEDNGIGVLSSFLIYHITELYGDREQKLNSMLGLNAAIVRQLSKKVILSDSMVKKVAAYIEKIGKQVNNMDYLIFEMLYGLSLADFCIDKKFPKLNSNYDKENDNRKVIWEKVTVQDLLSDVKDFNKRYSDKMIVSIDKVCDELEYLDLSKKVEDYSLYDSLSFFTLATLSKIRKENNLELENMLLENLEFAKILLTLKSDNVKIKTRVKKII